MQRSRGSESALAIYSSNSKILHTVNSLFSPPGGLFFLGTSRGGLIREGANLIFLSKRGDNKRGGLN